MVRNDATPRSAPEDLVEYFLMYVDGLTDRELYEVQDTVQDVLSSRQLARDAKDERDAVQPSG